MIDLYTCKGGMECALASMECTINIDTPFKVVRQTTHCRGHVHATADTCEEQAPGFNLRELVMLMCLSVSLP